MAHTLSVYLKHKKSKTFFWKEKALWDSGVLSSEFELVADDPVVGDPESCRAFVASLEKPAPAPEPEPEPEPDPAPEPAEPKPEPVRRGRKPKNSSK